MRTVPETYQLAATMIGREGATDETTGAAGGRRRGSTPHDDHYTGRDGKHLTPTRA